MRTLSFYQRNKFDLFMLPSADLLPEITISTFLILDKRPYSSLLSGHDLMSWDRVLPVGTESAINPSFSTDIPGPVQPYVLHLYLHKASTEELCFSFP